MLSKLITLRESTEMIPNELPYFYDSDTYRPLNN